MNGIPVEFPDFVTEAGTYLYTKVISSNCTSSGQLNITREAPDYTPRIRVIPGTISGPSDVDIIIDVIELEDKPSCEPIYVLVPTFGERYSFTYNSSLTTLGGGLFSVNNSHWQYLGNNGSFHIWQFIGSPTFPAGGFSRFGFSGVYNNQGTSGETRFSVSIIQGSGGEVNFINNVDGEVLFYRR